MHTLNALIETNRLCRCSRCHSSNDVQCRTEFLPEVLYCLIFVKSINLNILTSSGLNIGYWCSSFT